MVISTKQMQRLHQQEINKVNIHCNSKPIDRVNEWKLLGVTIDSNFYKHIDILIKNCYATLKVIKKLKKYTPINVRKQLAESLVLSKLDYCNALFYHLPKYKIQQMQKVQNDTAGFAYKKYGNIHDVISLKWLPIVERIENTIAKLAYKGLYDENAPVDLKLIPNKYNSSKRRKSAIKISNNNNIFVQDCATILSELPKDIQESESLSIFIKLYFR